MFKLNGTVNFHVWTSLCFRAFINSSCQINTIYRVGESYKKVDLCKFKLDIAYCINLTTLKAHTDRTRFGNATRFSGFQKSRNLLLGKFYWKLYNISTAGLVYFSYLPKFSIVDRFVSFWKMKNRATLPNRIRCVSALIASN
jgi:hypothetical protein